MLLGGLGWGEIAVVLLIALIVVGPERLPGVAEQAGKNLRKLRVWLNAMTDEVKAELGPEVGDLDLHSLHPKEFLRKNLFEDPDEDTRRNSRRDTRCCFPVNGRRGTPTRPEQPRPPPTCRTGPSSNRLAALGYLRTAPRPGQAGAEHAR